MLLNCSAGPPETCWKRYAVSPKPPKTPVSLWPSLLRNKMPEEFIGPRFPKQMAEKHVVMERMHIYYY